MPGTLKIEWMKEPEPHDWDAAVDYLSLTMAPDLAKRQVAAVRAQGQRRTFKAKDIIRASELPLLPADDAHVAKAIHKVKAGKPLSPILLLRAHGKIVIADGYHRACASYHIEDDTEVSVVIY